MGPINWLAVLLAAVAASAVLWVFWRGRGIPAWAWALSLVPAAMLGHALARIGPDKLAAKPHLYWMQSSGLALAIVIPALWLAGLKSGIAKRELVRDSAAFLFAYLAMGAVFRVFG